MKKTISIILIAVFAAVLGSSTFYIVRHNKEADKQAELYHNLASVVEAAAQTDAEAEPTEPIPYSEEKTILPELAELFGQNGDCQPVGCGHGHSPQRSCSSFHVTLGFSARQASIFACHF